MIVYTNFNQGRLGNQLFFVAATIGIARKNNTDYGFTSQLGHSGINYQSIFENQLPITNYIPEKKFYQNGFSYQDVFVDDVELIGYFQTEKFFSHCEELVRSQFEIKKTIKDELTILYPQISNSLSIHIRRGDYVNQPNHHPVVPLEYYNKILSQIGDSYSNIFVFSDDDNWVREKFIGDKFIFPKFEKDSDILSFVLMSMSKDNVIANSSYSWWAAWLNENKNKTIYSPSYKQWFGVSYSNLDTKDLIPDNWIQIQY